MGFMPLPAIASACITLALGKYFGVSLPKIEALPGSLQPELKRCGKDRCRCAHGELHGPYWYRRWREGGQQHKKYIAPDELETVLMALAHWRRLHPTIWSVRKMLAELHQNSRDLEV